MAVRDTTTIRVKNKFITEVLDKIIEWEKERGRDKVGYADASSILHARIMNAGGLKKKI